MCIIFTYVGLGVIYTECLYTYEIFLPSGGLSLRQSISSRPATSGLSGCLFGDPLSQQPDVVRNVEDWLRADLAYAVLSRHMGPLFSNCKRVVS